MANQHGLPDATSWTADQCAYMRWLATPRSARMPRTQQALAASLGVHRVTLSVWRRLPGFLQGAYRLALDEVEGDVPEILHALAREAKRGSLAHAKLLFEVCGFWPPRPTRHEHTGAGGGPLRIAIEIVDDREPPLGFGPVTS